MLTALLIDDEQNSTDVLVYDLHQYCPEVSVVATFEQPADAILFLKEQSIDVVFLDISMPEMSGFDFLDALPSVDFEIVFVTAYEEFALAAFDFYALDYLVKPVAPEKLIRAVERLLAKKKENQKVDYQNIQALLGNLTLMQQDATSMAIPTQDGYEILKTNEVVLLEAEGSYTKVILKVGDTLLVSRNLKDFERMLPVRKFARIHHSYIVNVDYIKKYQKGDGGIVTMSNGKSLAVSRANKTKLLSLIRGEL